MSSIGTTLKDARTKKAVTLEDVHSKIKIHPRVLQLLEEEKFERLPSPLFVKSFLKSYAEFLEVNSDELVGLYEKGKLKEPEQVLFMRTADEKARQDRHKPIQAKFFIVGAIVVALLAWVILPPVSRFIGHHVAQARERLASFYKNASVKKKAAKAKTDKKAPVAAVETEEKKVERDPMVLHSVELGNFQSIPKNEQLQLEIRAIDTVWLKILTDKKTAFQGLVKKGDKATATANDQIEISTGNPDNMFWTLNSRSIGSPGKGIARKMLVTRDSIRNLQAPRAE